VDQIAEQQEHPHAQQKPCRGQLSFVHGVQTYAMRLAGDRQEGEQWKGKQSARQAGVNAHGQASG